MRQQIFILDGGERRVCRLNLRNHRRAGKIQRAAGGGDQQREAGRRGITDLPSNEVFSPRIQRHCGQYTRIDESCNKVCPPQSGQYASTSPGMLHAPQPNAAHGKAAGPRSNQEFATMNCALLTALSRDRDPSMIYSNSINVIAFRKNVHKFRASQVGS